MKRNSKIWRMKIFSVLGLFLLIIVLNFGVVWGKEQVVIYSALDEKTTNILTKRFTERTGIETIVLNVAAAGTLAARIRSEAARPQADIFVGGSVEIHQPLAEAGLLVSYKSPIAMKANVSSVFLSPQGYWHGWYFGPLVIIVNKELYEQKLKPQGAPYPVTWDALLHPAYKRKVIGWNPATVGGGYIFLATQIFRFSDEQLAFEWLHKFDENVLTYVPTGPGPIPLVARGEAIAAVAWNDDSSLAKEAGQPIDIIFPPDDGAEIGAVSIIKGGPNLENAKRFVDFLYEKDIQKLKSDVGYTYPVRADVKPRPGMPELKNIHLVAYDREFALKNKERLIKKWEKEFGSRRR